MPEQIVVKAPDGKVIRFPDGMTADRVSAEMEKLYPSKKQPTSDVGGLRAKAAEYGKKGLEWAAEEGPTILGAAGGGVLGTALAPGLGTVAGAALGGGAARSVQNFMRSMTGDPRAPKTFGESAIDVGKAAISGGMQEMGAAFPLSKTGAGPALKQSAEKGIAKVLGPTKETTKDITEKKLVPGILKRGMGATFAMSRKGLKSKIDTALEGASAELEKVWAAIPATERMETAPLVQALERAKQQFVVEGVEIEPAAIKQLGKIQETLTQFGDQVSPQSLRKVRGVWDAIVARSGGYAGKTLSEESKLYSRREAANAIRRELASRYPDVAKVNAEFSFWQNMDEVLGATLKRTQSQSKPLGQQLVRAIAAGGGLTGYLVGASAPEVVIGVTAVAGLNELVRSTGWKLVSARVKNRLADTIASGNLDAAASMVNRLLVKTPSIVAPVKNRKEALDLLKKNQ